MRFLKYLGCFFSVALLAACGTTQNTASWTAPAQTQNLNHQKVAVLAVMDHLGARQSFEQQMVNQLQKESIDAISSMDLLPPQRRLRNVEQIIRSLKQKGVDAIMVVSLSDVDRNKEYVPGTTYYTPRTYYRRFGDYYVHSYRRVRTPGYLRKSTTYFLESSLYNLDDQSLIWMGAARTTDPASLQSASKSYAKSVVKSLGKEALI